MGITYAVGKVTKEIMQGSEPKSYVSMMFGAPDTWSRDAARDARVLGMVLQIRLREVLREDMGGVYGVRSFVSLSREPTMRREATISFGCDPANVEKLRDAALGVLRTIQKDGIGPEYLAKVTEQLKRARETDAKENWWWSSQLREAYWFGEDFTAVTDLDGMLARVTSDRVKAAASGSSARSTRCSACCARRPPRSPRFSRARRRCRPCRPCSRRGASWRRRPRP